MNNEGIVSPMIADIRAGMKRGKVVSLDEAMRVIRDGDTVSIDGFIGGLAPEELLTGLERRFLENGEPKNLTLVFAAGIGDSRGKGIDRLAHAGMLKRVIAGHWGLVPKLQRLALEGKIQAYNFPQGVITHMYRDIAGHVPRTVTHVGLGTFVDPRLEGGKVNSVTTEDMVELIHFDGREYLAYKTLPISVALLRGTTADMDGNISMEKEAFTLEVLPLAMAAKNSGGFVIVQVERIAERGALNARHVKIPGILVDCVVVSKPENHWQTYGTFYNPAYSCEFKVPTAGIEPMPMDERKIIARRAAFELQPNMMVNLGIGMPEGVARVASEEGIFDYLTLTAEAGSIGGIPSGGLDFGTATNMDCLIDMHQQFDFYDGGGLDMACLGLAQMEFRPIMKNVRLMDERIFKTMSMGLKDDLLSIPINDRLTYDPATNIFYVNFEGLAVRTPGDIEAIRRRVSEICAPLGKRVKTIVNYDNFSIVPELEDEYIRMVQYVVSTYYCDVTRYTTSAFLRMKLGDELKKRHLAPHIFQSKEEARQALDHKC